LTRVKFFFEDLLFIIKIYENNCWSCTSLIPCQSNQSNPLGHLIEQCLIDQSLLVWIETIGHETHVGYIITPPKQNSTIRGPSQDNPIFLDNSNIQIQNIKRISSIFIIGCKLFSQLLVDHKACLFHPPYLNFTTQCAADHDSLWKMLEWCYFFCVTVWDCYLLLFCQIYGRNINQLCKLVCIGEINESILLIVELDFLFWGC